MSVRILLADDHTILRQSLQTRLDAEPDFVLVGDAKDGLEALEEMERLRPDVLVLDIGMPGLNGIEVLERVRQRFPRTRVVVLSMYQDQSYVVQAFQNGAAAYVVKSADAKDLVHAVREVMAGRRYLSPPFTERHLEEYMKKAANGDTDPYALLTRREREVLQLVVEGFTNPQIARRLFIDTRTVETHRAHVMEKLGLRNLAELVRFAVQRGLLDAKGVPPGRQAEPPAAELAADDTLASDADFDPGLPGPDETEPPPADPPAADPG